MLQHRENFKLYEKVFAMFMYTPLKPFWQIKLLLFIEQKKERVRSHFRFLSMLYIIWVKVLYSNLIQRNVTI